MKKRFITSVSAVILGAAALVGCSNPNEVKEITIQGSPKEVSVVCGDVGVSVKELKILRSQWHAPAVQILTVCKDGRMYLEQRHAGS